MNLRATGPLCTLVCTLPIFMPAANAPDPQQPQPKIGSTVFAWDQLAAAKDRQNNYPSAAFTAEGMILVWSSHLADPSGSFAGQCNPHLGGGKCAIVADPEPSPSQPAAQARPQASSSVLRIFHLGDRSPGAPTFGRIRTVRTPSCC